MYSKGSTFLDWVDWLKFYFTASSEAVMALRFFPAFALAMLIWQCSQAVAQREAAPAAEKAAAVDGQAAAGGMSDAEKAKSVESPPTPKTVKDKQPAKAVEKPAPKKQIRLMHLSGSYVDLLEPLQFDPTGLLLGGNLQKPKSFFRLCDYIEEVAKEEIVTHVVFDLSDGQLAMNSAQLDELTRRLAKLKDAKKKTIAWLENPANVHLALAATCDQVVLADFGGVDMPSAVMESMFFRDAMDLIGVKASVVRAGDFKGAVEPFINPVMSDHLREHYREMLSSINDAQVSRIARGRAMTTAAVRDLQKERLLLPKEALAKGLVDQLAPYGSMKETINALVGEDLEWTTPKAKPKREMSFFELMGNIMSGPKRSTAKTKDDSIAVLHLSGAIIDGKESSPGSIVSGPTVKTIEELIKDEKIRGIVVRINSPGGSATASESIRRALDRLAKAKPLVFSMGEVAASGGYWITCIGQPIYAEHATITGSIGVFSMKISVGTLLRRIGVHIESVALDEAAAADSIDRPWSDEFIASLQEFTDDVYDKFLNFASTSRNIPVETLKSLAGGRVWSGEQAKKHKLIDEIGGLDACLAAVAKKAKLNTYKVIHRPEPQSGISLLDILGEGDSDEIRFWKSLSPGSLSLLRSQGFTLRSIRTILDDAAHMKAGPPTVWALLPAELQVK